MKIETVTCDFLFLGLPNSGKTVLIQQMKHLSMNKGDTSDLGHFETIPSIGVNLDQIQWKKKTIRIREVGGDLRITWHRYWDDCKAVVFVIDASNKMHFAAAVIELIKLCRSSQSKLFVLLNKHDAPNKVEMSEFEKVACLHELQKEHKFGISVSVVSGTNGHGLVTFMDNMVSFLK